jgi:Fe2+ transport system protein FeoA
MPNVSLRDERLTGARGAGDWIGDDSPTLCALAVLPAGVRVKIVRLACAQADAERLRVLGLFEGTHVRIVDRGSGLLLDVCGARLAVGRSLAADIMVLVAP